MGLVCSLQRMKYTQKFTFIKTNIVLIKAFQLFFQQIHLNELNCPVLNADNITKSYGKSTVLQDVSIQLKAGEVTGLIGKNGAGKTTLIRSIMQIGTIDKGHILFNAKPLLLSDQDYFGYLPEERGLYPKMKVKEQLLYLAQLKGMSKKKALIAIEELMQRYAMSDWKDKSIQELSKGMAQRVQFLAAIVHNPSIIILDEPFSGLDPGNAQALKEGILQLKKENKAILLSTHEMTNAEKLCDQLLFLHDGKIKLKGSPSQLLSQTQHKNEFWVECTQKLKSNTHFQLLKEQNGTYLIRNKSDKNLLQLLVEQGIDLKCFTPHCSTLEELFIDITK